MSFGRVAVAALAAAVVAVIGNIIVATVFRAISDIPATFEPFTLWRYSLFTVIGVIGAALVYWWIVKRSGDAGVRQFNIVAVIVLLLSFLPNLGLLVNDIFPGTTTAGVIALMLMHVVTAVACIILFPRLAPPE